MYFLPGEVLREDTMLGFTDRPRGLVGSSEEPELISLI